MSQGFSIPRFRLPSLVSAIGAHLPQWPHSLALATALNAATKLGLLPEDSLALLEGRSFVVEVLDAGGQACFCYRGGLFRPLFSAPAGAGPLLPGQSVGFPATAGTPGRPGHAVLQP
jgi:hypothetical protein